MESMKKSILRVNINFVCKWDKIKIIYVECRESVWIHVPNANIKNAFQKADASLTLTQDVERECFR